MTKKIFIFGSKPELKIPIESCDMVFSANGGAYYASKYLSKISGKKIKHINISTDQGFIKIPKLRQFVENSRPDKIIFRGNRIKIEKHSKIIANSSIDLEYQSYISQFLFQRKFFKKGLFDLFLAEMNYENVILECKFKKNIQTHIIKRSVILWKEYDLKSVSFKEFHDRFVWKYRNHYHLSSLQQRDIMLIGLHTCNGGPTNASTTYLV